MAENTCGADFLSGFLVGALVGAAAALILAPQSGEDTRSFIREKSVELRGQAEELTQEARKRAEEFGDLAKEKAESVQSQIRLAVDEGKTAASRRKEDLLSRLEEEQETSVEAPEE